MDAWNANEAMRKHNDGLKTLTCFYAVLSFVLWGVSYLLAWLIAWLICLVVGSDSAVLKHLLIWLMLGGLVAEAWRYGHVLQLREQKRRRAYDGEVDAALHRADDDDEPDELGKLLARLSIVLAAPHLTALAIHSAHARIEWMEADVNRAQELFAGLGKAADWVALEQWRDHAAVMPDLERMEVVTHRANGDRIEIRLPEVLRKRYFPKDPTMAAPDPMMSDVGTDWMPGGSKSED